MAITLKKKNYAKGTLNAGISNSDMSFTLKSGEGTKFPDVGSDNPFRGVFWGASYSVPEKDPNREIIEAYRSSGDTFTITSRGIEGTTAKAWNADDNFALVFTSGTIEEIETEIENHTSASSAHGVSGNIVGTSGSQTITGKRNQKRLYSTTSASSLTPEIANYDIFQFTALAENVTINNHSSSTPADGEMMEFIFHDNGTSRTISWGSYYVNGGVALPTATTIGKVTRVLVQWFSTDSKWHCIGNITES